MKSTCLRLLIDHRGGPLVSTLKDARTIVERRTVLRHQLGGAARWIHLGLSGTLPWGAPPHAEASDVEADARVACHCTVAGVESWDGLALVDWLFALIWELAQATVGTVKVADLLGQAFTCEEPLDVWVIVTCRVRSGASVCGAQATRSPLNAFFVINVASTPLGGDWVALCQALIDVEAIWHLRNAHHPAVILVLACTLKTDNLIVQSHLLALCITGFLPIGPARPHPAVSAVASTRVVCNGAFAGECWDGEAVWPFSLPNGKIIQRVITPTRLV